MELKIAVCGDSDILAESVRQIISKLYPENIVEIMTSGDELLSATKAFDLIFLDIEMPDKSGMQVAKELKNRECEAFIVFLTSHEEYMRDAFSVRAFRYLTKPVKESDVKEVIENVMLELMNIRTFIIGNDNDIYKVREKDILYVEAFRKGCKELCRNKLVDKG